MSENYIGKIDAEWVDPKVELPKYPNLYVVKYQDGLTRYVYFYCKKDEPIDPEIVAWLRIGGPSTAIPRITGRHPDGSDALQVGLAALGFDGLVCDDECACDGCIACGWNPSDCSCAYEHKYHPSHCTNWYALTPCSGDDCEVCGRWKPEVTDA